MLFQKRKAGTVRLDLVGSASFVLLGEGSHGTHDFYHERAEITKRLIAEKGFSAVAVEVDPEAAKRAIRQLSRGLCFVGT
ncbi:MAG TPA: hypothetical protein VGQ98_09560 [Gemmatimonadaceae bacterium]|nr:hypothetical protein [Gemmatimonadaceae bacterium]